MNLFLFFFALGLILEDLFSQHEFQNKLNVNRSINKSGTMNLTLYMIYSFKKHYFTIYHFWGKIIKRIEVVLIGCCYMSALQHLHLLVGGLCLAIKMMCPYRIKQNCILPSDDKVRANWPKMMKSPCRGRVSGDIMMQCANICF